MGNLTYNSDYDVRLATLGELGGDITKKYDSVYAIDLEILKIIQEGGIGGASINDEHVSTTTTYSSSKIMTLLADAGFSVEVVQALPSTGDAHTIYFVPKTGSTGDIYDEYLYVDNAWELIGSTEIDLSNYYNKSEVDVLLNDKQDELTAGNNISIDANGVISANFEVATVEEVEELFAPKAVKFTANASSTVGLSSLSTNQTLEYSVDEGATWNNMDTSTSVSLAQGDKMYVRGQLSGNNSTSNYTRFTMSGSISASGSMNYIWNKNNPKSTTLSYTHCGYYMFNGCDGLNDVSKLTLPANTLADYCYQGMFTNCTLLTTAPSELPATKLVQNCYSNMFDNCASLTSAPALPATTLAISCYQMMFNRCISLTTTPELPATTAVLNCYYMMFQGCRSLTTAPELPATTVAQWGYRSMFNGCTSLTTAPELPATTLASDCYDSMFRGCTNLTTAPSELPATTLASSCYNGMFRDCTSLTTAPELPATTLENSCYSDMFRGCTNLTTAPSELPATTLVSSCYNNMFQNCTSLTTAPELPATTLENSCYSSMFEGCTSLTSAPELPATTLTDSCYRSMFYGCTSLTSAPELPATTLTDSCYRSMFEGCSRLNYIKCLATNISANNCTTNWVNRVSYRGTFVKNSAMSGWPTTGNNGIPTGWTVDIDVDAVEFTANDASTIGLASLSSNQTLEYSTDGYTWNTMDTNTVINLASGSSAYIRGQLSGNNRDSDYTQFTMTGSIAASGSANYLWNKNNPNSTTLSYEYCGKDMFRGCISLTTAPELPATTLSNGCYSMMFGDCNITTAPELPATTLTNYCYEGMFWGSSLNYIKCLATNISATGCTENWLTTVSETGTFVKNPAMSDWTTGYAGIPEGWTVQDA